MEETHKNSITLSLSNPPLGPAYTNQACVNSENGSHTPTLPPPYSYLFQETVDQPQAICLKNPGDINPAIPDVKKSETSQPVQTDVIPPSYSYLFPENIGTPLAVDVPPRSNENTLKRKIRHLITLLCNRTTIAGCLLLAALIFAIIVVAAQKKGNSVGGASNPISRNIDIGGIFTRTNPNVLLTPNEDTFCTGVKQLYGTLYGSCNIIKRFSLYGFRFIVTLKTNKTRNAMENLLFDAMKTERDSSFTVFENMDINSIKIGSLTWKKPKPTTISTTQSTTTRRPTNIPSSVVSKALSCDFHGSNNKDHIDKETCRYRLYSSGSTGEYSWRTGRGNNGNSSTVSLRDPFGGYGYYVYTNALKGKSGDLTQLRSPSVRLFDNSHCLNFWNHMYGDDIGKLSLLIYVGNRFEVLWNRTGEPGQEWRKALVRLPRGEYKVAFQAIKGIGRQEEIALDAISVTKGNCDKSAVCYSTEFRCGTGECISKYLKCDHVNNCPDKSDEAGCLY